MAPAGAVGLAGVDGGAVVVDGDGGELLGRGVGKVGSVGPVPGVATGFPSMMELQPETNPRPASSTESSSEPPARLRRAFCDNCTRRSRKSQISGLRLRMRQRKSLQSGVYRCRADGAGLPLRDRLAH